MIDIISHIADLQAYPKPNPVLGIGRECYAFSDLEDKAFALLQVEAERLFERYQISAEKYDTRNDAIGNLFVTFYGKDRSKTVMSGSHVDSVYKGGVYDGVAGVHSAFCFLEKLLMSGKVSDYNYTVVVFRAEEASPKTGNSCLGSRVATGTLSEQDLLKIHYKTDPFDSAQGRAGKSIPLRDFFAQKYGSKCWQEVIAELKDPPIKKENVIVYEELHIEQSAVCTTNNVDVGIVIDGIGGAIREVVHIPLAPKFLPEMLVNKGEYFQYVVKFTGEEAHSGGTPPNPTFTRQDSAPWYRRDALIGSAVFIQALQKSVYSSVAKLLQCSIPHEVGFTTVPKEQHLTLLIPAKDKNHFEKYLESFGREVLRDLAVDVNFQREQVPSGTIKYYDAKVLEALQIPLYVEQLVREKCREQIREANEGALHQPMQGGVGKVRGTVTDFHINQEPALRCNLDFRDVDPSAIENIVKAVHERIQQVAIRLMDPTVFPENIEKIVRMISRKPYTAMNEQAIEDKARIAKKLDYKTMQMPSLPNHDAASLGAIGVPITMTFVRHDGRSHTGYETMPQEYYEKAERLSHAYLAEKLGIIL